MLKHLHIFILLFANGFSTQAQETLPAVIVKRLQVAEPDISKQQSFYYKRKEEFHQALVRDIGERTGKMAPAAFYVDFLAQKEKVKGEYIVEVRWVNLVFYNAQTEVRRLPSNMLRSDGTRKEQEEYKFVYTVDAVLEILIYKNENDSLKSVYEMSEPLKYKYETTPRISDANRPNMVPTPSMPDKPLIFKELNLTYYTLIKETILNYFNGKV